jgi:hypothetical protein
MSHPRHPTTVFLRISCANHSGHGPFEVRRDVLLQNSRVLWQQLLNQRADPTSEGSPTPPQLVLDCAGDGYDCRILKSIISTWEQPKHVPVGLPDLKSFDELQQPKHVPVGLDLKPFDELQQLARALWKYGCLPRRFEPFANKVQSTCWEEHYRAGLHSHAWAFIAVVFGWGDVFVRAVMDMPELADDLQPQYPPNPWPEQFERSVLQEIVRKYRPYEGS